MSKFFPSLFSALILASTSISFAATQADDDASPDSTELALKEADQEVESISGDYSDEEELDSESSHDDASSDLED